MLQSTPGCLASFPPLCVAEPTFPRRAGGGAWGCPGGQEHPSPLLPGAAAASPRAKRAGRSAGGRGPRDRSGRWARLGAQRGRGRPRGRARRQNPESNAAGGVWDSDLNSEPGLCWSEVEMPATPSLTPASALCPAARHGDAVAPCPRGRAIQEAVPGGATEGPLGALWVSQMSSAAPTTKLESERGGRAGGGHSEFPATFPGCGKQAAL